MTAKTNYEIWEERLAKEQAALDRPHVTEPTTTDVREEIAAWPGQPNGKPSRKMTAEQQIRAKALEIATATFAQMPAEHKLAAPEEFQGLFWDGVKKFEDYIRSGK